MMENNETESLSALHFENECHLTVTEAANGQKQ